MERGAAQAVEAAEEGEVAVAASVGGAFGYLGGLAEGAAALGKVAGTLAGAAGVGVAAAAGLAVGIVGGAEQGSEDAAVQDVRSANNMNDATQHFTLRSGSSTSGSPARGLLAVRLPRAGAVRAPSPGA